MKKSNRNIIFSITAILSFTFSGCLLMEKPKTFGSNITKGITSQLNINLDSIVYNLTKNAELGLTDPVAKRKTQLALDTLVASLGSGIKTQVDSLMKDTLINYKIQSIVVNLKNELLGKKTSEQLQAIITGVREDAIGTQTQKEVKALIDSIVNEVGGGSTQTAIKRIKNTLLGDSTKNQLSGIVASVVDTLTVHYNKGLAKTINSQITFFTDKGLILIVAVTLALLLIIGFVWYKKHQQLVLMNQIMFEIHRMPNQQYYDELTYRIKNNVSNKTLLNKLLAKQDILGEDAWKRRLKKENNLPG